MRVTVSWDDSDKSILRVEVRDGWDWVAYDKATGEIHALLADVNQPVDVIFQPVDGLAAPMEFIFLSGLFDEKVRDVVIVGTDQSFKEALLSLGDEAEAIADRISFQDTIEDAHSFLNEKYG